MPVVAGDARPSRRGQRHQRRKLRSKGTSDCVRSGQARINVRHHRGTSTPTIGAGAACTTLEYRRKRAGRRMGSSRAALGRRICDRKTPDIAGE